MDIEAFFQRFRIEPRRTYKDSKETWLVVYDRVMQGYIKKPGSKAYKRFDNSDDIINFIIDYYMIGEEV